MPQRTSASERTPPASDDRTEWRAREQFGDYLRAVRERLGFSLREAAQLLGLSYSYVSKIETGARENPPSMRVLQTFADRYLLDIREVLYEAGMRPDVYGGADEIKEDRDARFHRLVSHPRLRPAGMNKTVEACLSPLVKEMVIDLAFKIQRENIDIATIVDGRPSPSSAFPADADGVASLTAGSSGDARDDDARDDDEDQL